ncbi:hypothetical protein D3C76_1616290 [compost metagenome]
MGDLRDGGIGDVAAASLDSMEYRQQRTGGVAVVIQHTLDHGQFKGRIRHTADLGITDQATRGQAWLRRVLLRCTGHVTGA